MSHRIEKLHEALEALGLTGLEAEVYTSLLRLQRATGYRIAKETGRPTANVYKALAALVTKGAVLAQEDGDGQFVAVPARRFVRQLRATFVEHEQTVVAAAEELSGDAEPAGIFAIHTTEQFRERLAALIKGARRVVLVDASPAMLAIWEPALAAAAQSKRVLIKAYEPAKVSGAEVTVDPRGPEIRGRWGVEWCHAVADGSELILSAHLDGQLRRGVWTEEPFVTVTYHEALASEILFTGVTTRLGPGAPDAVKRFISRGLESVRLDERGFDRLIRQLGARRERVAEDA
jgi:HTH-type transcriptional regulator, sugar sensing transcriptional regulator